MAVFAQIASIVLVVIGFAINHILALHRDKRKEQREQLKNSLELLSTLKTDALIFHQNDKFDPSKQTEIRFKSERLITLLKLNINYQKSHKNDTSSQFKQRQKNLLMHYLDFKMAIERNNFDLSTFIPQPPESTLLLDISSTAIDLEVFLETQFRIHYPL